MNNHIRLQTPARSETNGVTELYNPKEVIMILKPNWFEDGTGRIGGYDMPSCLFDFSISTLEDARKYFPNVREGWGLSPIDRSLILHAVNLRGGLQLQLIKNQLEGRPNWVQITNPPQ